MNGALDSLALEIDTAVDDGNVSVLKALLIKCSDTLEAALGKDRAILRFYEANCYSALAIIRSSDPGYAWSWEQQERVSEILCLRYAILEDSFNELDPILQCKILTNLGCNLNQFGRIVEAIKSWDFALQGIPNFAMALGNKGIGLIYYGQSLYDHGHTGILTAHAKDELYAAISESTLWDSGLHPEAENDFRQHYDSSIQYLEDIEYNFEFNLDQWPLGEGEDDINYRGWCLHHRLFLSPLNDVCRHTAAAQDIIHLPSHSYNIGEKPRFPNYFNLLKQEYVSARYMLFEAFIGGDAHVADKGVLLLDGFDGTRFGYHNELLKTAYRLTYSLFDKIALFLNDYFSVGLKAGSVSFRRIWGRKVNKKFKLYPCFEESKNWPLRGLYYLSKDLFDEDFIDVSLPDAKELASLRNRTEHRFLSLQSYPSDMENTEIHSYITVADFEEKTLRIMSMAREALIYLSLAMHREEEIRDKEKDSDKITVHVQSISIERVEE